MGLYSTGKSICGNAFELLGQRLNQNINKMTQTVNVKCKCPKCGEEFAQPYEIKATGISSNINFNVSPGGLNPWQGGQQ